MRRDEARAAARGRGHPLARRRDAARRAGGGEPRGVSRQLGLVTRDEFEELELRVAQLEHRLRLVEGPAGVLQPLASALQGLSTVFAAVVQH